MNIFTLTGRILVDNARANENIDGTASKSDNLANKFSKGLQNAAKTATIAIAAVATATVAVGKGLLTMAEKSAEATDRVDKMSQRLGMSRQAFQEWDFVLSQNGVSIDSMQTAMKQLTKHMAGVKDGAETNIEVYKRLDSGIIRLIRSGASQEEVFKATIISFQKMPESVEKARLAQELFGKQGQEMLPMLNASKGSLDALIKKARDLGLVMSDTSIDAGVKFKDTMDQLKRTFEALTTQLGVSVIPIFQEMADTIIKNMPKIKENVTVFFDIVAKVFLFLVEHGRTVIVVLSTLLTIWMAFSFVIFFNNLTTSIKGLAATFATVTSSLSPASVAMIKWGAIIIGVALAVTALVIAINFLLGKGDQMNQMVSSVTNTAGSAPQQSANFTRNYSGSHKQGLSRVPYDGYIAETHEDEAILKKEDADKWRKGESNANMDETNNLLRILTVEFAEMKQAYKEQPRENLRLAREGAVY